MEPLKSGKIYISEGQIVPIQKAVPIPLFILKKAYFTFNKPTKGE